MIRLLTVWTGRLTVPEQIKKYKAGPSRLLRELEFMEYAQAFPCGRSYASELNSKHCQVHFQLSENQLF